jgi:SH3 domain protein
VIHRTKQKFICSIGKTVQITLYLIFAFNCQQAVSESEEITDQANSRYIIDRIYVSLREKPSDSSRSVERSLKSGTPLLLLEENIEEGYSLVQTETGTKGWIKTQYLQKEPIAAMQLPELQEKIQELSSQGDKELLKTLEKTRKELKQTAKENESLKKELKEIKYASSNAIRINDQNKEMIEKIQILQSELDAQEAITEQLKSDRSTSQWLFGAMIVFVTILVMLFYDGMKKRRSYGSEW